MKSVALCYAWKYLWDVMRWNCHQTLCTFLYDHQEGEKVPIPTECPEDTHPLKVFEETHVEKNVSMGRVCIVVDTTPECLAMVSNHSKGVLS